MTEGYKREFSRDLLVEATGETPIYKRGNSSTLSLFLSQDFYASSGLIHLPSSELVTGLMIIYLGFGFIGF